MKIKIMRSVLVALFCISVFSSTVFTQKQTIYLYIHNVKTYVDAVEKLIDDYKEVNPDVKIDFTPVELDSYHVKMATLLASQGKMDIYLVHNVDIMKYLPFLEEAPDFVVEDIENNFPDASRVVNINGKYYGYAYTDTMAPFVNIDMYQDAGVDHPEYYEDLPIVDQKITAAMAQSSPDIERYGVNIYVGRPVFTFAYWDEVLMSYGASMLDEKGQPNFNNEAGVKALKLFKSVAHPDVGMWDSFAQGTIATMINASWAVGWVNAYAKEGLNWTTILPLKGTDGTRKSEGYFIMWAVPNFRPAESQKAAFEFLQWVYSKENTTLRQTAGLDMWRFDLASTIEEEYPRLAKFLEAAQYAQLPIMGKNYAAIEKVVCDMIDTYILEEGLSEKELLDQAYKDVMKVISE